MTIKYALTYFFLVLGLISFSQEPDSLISKMEAFNESGDYNKSISIYRSLKRKHRQSLTGEQQKLLASAFLNTNNEDSAYYFYKLAKDNFNRNNDLYNVALINLEISSLLESQNNLDPDNNYFQEYWDYAIEENERDLIAKGYNYLGRVNYKRNDSINALYYFRESARLFDSLGNIPLAVNNWMNIGAVLSYKMNQQDSARYFYQIALSKLNADLHYETSNSHFNLLNNIGNTYRRSKNYNQALTYYFKADSIQVKDFPHKTKKILYGNMEASYYYLGDYQNAYNYLYKVDSLKNIINLAGQNTTILEIKEKYDNEKLRADNLQSETRRLRNRNLLIGSLALIIIGASTSIFIYKNTTKKRLLAEQKSELKQQRVDNLLKEQELMSIDAMIAGQEKERQKVANELHDDLGSLMATIKLHFDQAEVSKIDSGLQNAQKLLEEAYQKIRGMAHTKNSGVMSDQGLIPALQKMADIITQTDGMEVKVEHYGMGERLENSLELTIFRMIQELTTNILKHANATKANIQLTQHEENINIIVEDNGKGFDYSVISKNDGMGLTNIEKRIENLEGSFTVDSVPGKGTSILIDLPV